MPPTSSTLRSALVTDGTWCEIWWRAHTSSPVQKTKQRGLDALAAARAALDEDEAPPKRPAVPGASNVSEDSDDDALSDDGVEALAAAGGIGESCRRLFPPHNLHTLLRMC